jgi:hypothetical protein
VSGLEQAALDAAILFAVVLVYCAFFGLRALVAYGAERLQERAQRIAAEVDVPEHVLGINPPLRANGLWPENRNPVWLVGEDMPVAAQPVRGDPWAEGAPPLLTDPAPPADAYVAHKIAIHAANQRALRQEIDDCAANVRALRQDVDAYAAKQHAIRQAGGYQPVTPLGPPPQGEPLFAAYPSSPVAPARVVDVPAPDWLWTCAYAPPPGATLYSVAAVFLPQCGYDSLEQYAAALLRANPSLPPGQRWHLPSTQTINLPFRTSR